MKIIPFTHNNQDYEIRVVSDGFTIYVRAFKNGKPANGYVHQVTMPVAFDMQRMLGVSAIDDLIETAKHDVVNNTWEKFLDAVESLKKTT